MGKINRLYSQKSLFIVLFGIIILQLTIQTISMVSGANDLDYTIDPYESITIYEEYGIQVDPAKEDEGKLLEFKAEHPCSIILLNKTQLLAFQNTEQLPFNQTFSNSTDLSVSLNYEILIKNYHADSSNRINNQGTKYKIAKFYIIILNQQNSTTQCNLRIDYQNEFLLFINSFSELALTIAFFALGFVLIFNSLRLRKEEENIKSLINRNFGFGYILAGLGNLVWEFYHWYRRLSPEDNWERVFITEIPVSRLSQNYLIFMTLILFGFCILAMEISIEKSVQNRPHPYLAIAMLISTILLAIGAAFNVILEFLIYQYVIIIAINVLNVVFTYLKIILHIQGVIRRNTIFILLGFIVPILTFALRDFFGDNYIFNFMAIFAMILFYQGMK